MASKVDAALGTQRQFSAMPKGTYEKQLTAPSVASSSASSGVALARSLGVLGDALENFAVNEEKNKEKVGTAVAERIIKGTSQEDLAKLHAIDILNNSGNTDLKDNPYAVALIEKWRGKYFASKTLTEYGEMVAEKNREKTMDGEAQRFAKFYAEKLPDLVKNTTNQQAFREGFYDNFHVDMLNQIKGQVEESTKERKAIRNGELEAQVGQLAQASLNMTPDDLKAKAQEILRSAAITNMKPDERIALGKSMLNLVASFSYSPDKVKALSDLELYVGDDGNPVKFGDKIDNSEAIQLAINGARRMNSEAVFKKRNEMQNLKPEQFQPWLNKLKEDDPNMWRILSPDADSAYNHAVAEEKRAKAQQAKLAAKSAARNQKNLIYEAQFNAYMRNSNTDGRYPVARSLSDLPKATYVDENGNTVTDSHNKEDVYEFLKGKMMMLYGSNLPANEKAAQALRMLNWGPGSWYAEAIKGQVQGSLDTADANTMANDEGLGSVRMALEMMDANSGNFSHLFGADVTSQIQAIRAMRDLGKDTSGAIDIFVKGREALKDPTLKSLYKSNYDTSLRSSPNMTIRGMDGDYTSLGIEGDPLLATQIHTTSMYLQGGGYNSDMALDMAKTKAAENYWGYNGHAFPKAWFDALDVENKAATAVDFLDNERSELASKAGIANVDNVFAVYNPYTNCIEIKGNGVSASYDHGLFIAQANQFAYNSVQQARNTPQFEGDYTISAPTGEEHDPSMWETAVDKAKNLFSW